MSVIQKDIAAEPYYPSSDGQPMAETSVHMRIMIDTIETLISWFNSVWVWVWGNMFLYYVKGDTSKNVAPDIFVVKGVRGDHHRDTYKLWEEGQAPDCVMEITSRSSQDTDQQKKFHIYQDILKVPEYILFDPFGDYLSPQLKGYRLVNGKYQPIQEVNGRLPSEVLGLHLEAGLGELRLYDPRTDEYLLTPRDAAGRAALVAQRALEARQAEAQARQAEAQARQQAEAEAERLRRELESLRQQLPKQP